jgi:hypothetical protein
MGAGDGADQVGCKRSDTALSRQVISDKGDFADFGILFQITLSARMIKRSGAAPTK